MVLAYNDGGDSLAAEIVGNGSPVIACQIAGNWSLRLPLQIARVLRDFSIDIVVCHSARADFFGTCVARAYGIPVVQYIHGPFYNESRAVRFLDSMVAGLRDVTIVNSRATGRYVKRVLVEREQRVILNGWPDLSVRMGASDRDAMREEFGFPVGAVVLGNVGRMIPLRRQVMLVDLVRLLRIGFQVNAYLIIVGDGPEYDSARRRAHELGVRDYVSLVGAHRRCAYALEFGGRLRQSDGTRGLRERECRSHAAWTAGCSCPCWGAP